MGEEQEIARDFLPDEFCSSQEDEEGVEINGQMKEFKKKLKSES